jgi:hypothetical protein
MAAENDVRLSPTTLKDYHKYETIADIDDKCIRNKKLKTVVVLMAISSDDDISVTKAPVAAEIDIPLSLTSAK